ncbi:MAG: NapC/NirT family cytochrome c [Rhodospirillales bacterium]|nr:NapC/NirT family cytochrome c [Rhodospirillales bacterium]
MSEEKSVRGGIIGRLWRWFWGPAGKWSLGLLLIVGFTGGIMFWGAFNWGLALSNTEAFCVSCHEMRDTPFAELKETVHYSNASGVRAVCSDCHVPKEWGHKMVRKIQATFNELPKHFLGVMDTPAKYEARRLEMARNVWQSMKATDSRECRNCHAIESMLTRKQKPAARKKHATMRKEKLTCIECHQGIAHKLPEGWDEPESKPDKG